MNAMNAMNAAAGFVEVMRETGEVKTLVDASAAWMGNGKAIGALLMPLLGLLVTIGIGSSFSTEPIIAAIFVPRGVELGCRTRRCCNGAFTPSLSALLTTITD